MRRWTFSKEKVFLLACQSELELANLHKHCCKVAQDPMQAPRDKLYQDIAACSHKHSAGASHMTTPAPDGACLVHREALALAKMAALPLATSALSGPLRGDGERSAPLDSQRRGRRLCNR